MGVLLSLGARKSGVVGQVLVELILVGTVAFGLSIGTSTFLARAMGDGLLQSQITASQNENADNYGRPGTAPSGGHAGHGEVKQVGNNASDAEAISTIDITSTPSDYALLFAVGYAILVVALVVPTANIMRFEPKTILTGKE